jgi:hypothetical protein
LRRDPAVPRLYAIGGTDVSTYLAANAIERLALAQLDVDRHVATGWDGRCRACGDVEPCRTRVVAGAVFARYGSLPVRRPGLASSGLR